jgi:tRNA A-37 threonylcarbamoyl transferase component Bud32
MSSSDRSPSPVSTSSAPQTPDTPPPLPLSTLPQFGPPGKTTFLTDPRFLARGGHSHVYTVTLWHQNRSRTTVLKVFTSRHKRDYLDEINAYRYLHYHGIIDEGIVPRVFGTDKWGIKQFEKILAGVETDDVVDFPVRVILMEYVHGERLSTGNVSVEIAMKVLNGIRRIHWAGVEHNDVAERNVLVTDEGRVVWIDFSNAKCRVRHLPREIEYEKVKNLLFNELVRHLLRCG